MRSFDAIIIGAGVLGSAAARALISKGKARSVAVLEKESAPAIHTSGRNSGVLHSGFNLKPGSLKARFCVEGNRRLTEFCQQKNISLEPVGTLVVAQNTSELPVLEELLRRGQANGVPHMEIISAARLKELEPNAVGIAALHSPSGAVVSGEVVTHAIVSDAQAQGCEFFFNHQVMHITSHGTGYRVETLAETFEGKLLINCAGLYADEIAHSMGVGLQYTIIPFRGQYYKIRSDKRNIVHSMVYPVPDLNFPFLGVHWTRTVTGDLKVGPNAMLAFGREAYTPWSINILETLKMVSRVNFWRLWKSPEFRRLLKSQFWISISRQRFIEEARKLVPNVLPEDFSPGKSGNRAQLVDRQGRLVEDMVIERQGNSLHVLNAVSPGFTCSLPFADHLVDQFAS